MSDGNLLHTSGRQEFKSVTNGFGFHDACLMIFGYGRNNIKPFTFRFGILAQNEQITFPVAH